MVIIINEDETYLDWIASNPAGFVLNCYRNMSPEYLVLHKATCGTIGTSARENWTTAQYIKACSNDRLELLKWAEKDIGGELTECSLCKP